MAWFNLGKAYYRTRRLEEAIGCLDRSLEIHPDHSSALNNKAVALRELGRFEEAIETYDALLATDPFYYQGWENKGHLLKAMGIPDEAQVCFEMALMIKSGAPAAPPGGKRGKQRLRAAPVVPRLSAEEIAREPDVSEDEERDEEPEEAPRRAGTKGKRD